jgi:hypothetical protein
MRKLGLILFLCMTNFGFGQNSTSSAMEYPENYFRNPLDIPLVLSGTFGELRTNHFHAGLDIKTMQQEGLKVYASAAGYVSRIKISHWGYGKAIYIRHPNGYTTVYAHLKKFGDRIEQYIKKQQYKKESFEIQVFPGADILPIRENEIIAYSGSTGGFVGPHLHFEIRDSKTEKPINPMFFGVSVNDAKPPVINTLVGYSMNNRAHINGKGMPIQLTFKKLENGDLVAHKIHAFGAIGFGIHVYDQLDGATNKNGIFSLEMQVNGKVVHRFEADSFSFAESKYINLLIDYERLERLNQRIHKSFIEPGNKLSLYDNLSSKGLLIVEDSLDYNVEIIAKDFEGNQRRISIPIVGQELKTIAKKDEIRTLYKIDRNEFKKFSFDKMTLSFPKNTFYEDVYLNLSSSDNEFNVHRPTLPLHKNYTLTVDVSNYSASERKQLYIASISKKGTSSYMETVKKDKIFYTSTKKLGMFKLLRDSIAPNINLFKFNDEQWLSNHNTLKVKIADTDSGIRRYRGEIDGEWILMEYNVKDGTLTYDFNDKIFENAKHQLKVTVSDKVGNSKTIHATFFRKK